ncbi:hypothetical protein ACN47E_004273 [Coniothyrium glycines]
MSSAARCRVGWRSCVFVCAFVGLPCVVGDGWRTWPLLAIWTLGSCARLLSGDRQVVVDSCLFGVVYGWTARQTLGQAVVKNWSALVTAIQVARTDISFLALGVATVLAAAWVGFTVWRAAVKSTAIAELPPTARKWDIEHPEAKIFPCRTTHARIFPKTHTFAYSYLQCGFPIVPEATTAGGIDVSSGRDQTLGRWWMCVKAEDYLNRGNGSRGFYGKLKMYLRQQHVGDSEWSYAYLVTAPRFFGYAFNPVSFWYIYDQDHHLKKMILEVNNTFGERRMYLLDGSSPPSPPLTPDLQATHVPDLAALDMAKSKFTDVWMKDFHVSPFNSRKGSYALKALDPFPHATFEAPTIDNTITLKSSKDNAKVVARLFSTQKAIDPDSLGFAGALYFILSWWWVGLVTFPRIIREAIKLFFKRKLHVWYRPEVLTSSIGRLPTASEIILHGVFRDYLRQLVQQSSQPFCITFKAGIPNVATEMIETKRQSHNSETVRNIELRVLTPAFYSRLVHYNTTSEAMDRECVFTDERNRTLWVCRPQLLSRLLSERNSLHIAKHDIERAPRSCLDELRWQLLKKLRCAPPEPAYSVTPQNLSSRATDIRNRPYSELDQFMRSSVDIEHAGLYRRTVTETFLAERFSLGFTGVVDMLDILLRAVLCCIGALQLRSSRDDIGDFAMRSLLHMNSGAYADTILETKELWWVLTRSFTSILACHAYGLLKGYQ